MALFTLYRLVTDDTFHCRLTMTENSAEEAVYCLAQYY